MKIHGRVWKYGDNIDTDIIYPGKYLVSFDPEEAARHAMEGIEVDFYKKISKGDILLVGKNFGSGSAREQASLALKYAGVGAILSENFPRTFYRNSINIGLPVIEVSGIKDVIDEKDELEIDLEGGIIKNITKGEEYRFPSIPAFIIEILKSGGAVPFYKKRISS